MNDQIRSNDAKIAEENAKVQVNKNRLNVYLNPSNLIWKITRKKPNKRESKIALDREIRAKKEEMKQVDEKIHDSERKAQQTQRSIDGNNENILKIPH